MTETTAPSPRLMFESVGRVRECAFPGNCGGFCNCPQYSAAEYLILTELRTIRKLLEVANGKA